jgi:D-alanyl-lipoteichoic acid acyltransferase DltB (MBOAT superfamily)
MLFNSYEFIFVFLPITFFVYFYLNSKRLTEIGKGFLVFSSLFFYSYWEIKHLPLILGSMLVNYLIGTTLSKYDNKESKKTFSKKFILIFGIVCNVGLLGYFKYADFFIENFNLFAGSDIELLDLILPLAISFFTFQQIAYLIDSYKNETKEYDFLNYALFVTFFPQLIAGPIVHHKEMMPQFANVRNKVKNYRNIALGIFIFSMGLFKKVVIADTFAVWANAGFDTATTLNFFEAWATSLSYTFQLYFDFSGYTDMAIGIALLFNIKLPINFNSPYKALDIQDFWRRWHITLSRFLRDYVYIPLGGNRISSFRTYTNLIATFIIGGLWHGAGWIFIFWGFLHGVALAVNRAWQTIGFKLPKIIAWFITFNFVNIAWIFFRAKEWDDAIKVLSGMVGMNVIVLPKLLSSKLSFLSNYGVEFGRYMENIQGSIYTLFSIIIGFIIILFLNNTNKICLSNLNLINALFVAVSFICFHFISNLYQNSIFLYFNF